MLSVLHQKREPVGSRFYVYYEEVIDFRIIALESS